MSVIAGETSVSPEQPVPTTPDPPHYTSCTTYRKRFLHAGATQAVTECKREYDKERLKALYFLIPYRWLTGEAAHLGIVVSAKMLDQRRAKLESAYPKALLRHFLVGVRGIDGDF
jgi:hypothetical protein